MMKYNKKKRDVDCSLCQSGFRVICSQYTQKHTHFLSEETHFAVWLPVLHLLNSYLKLLSCKKNKK